MGRPPPQILGGPFPQSSLGLRPWQSSLMVLKEWTRVVVAVTESERATALR